MNDAERELRQRLRSWDPARRLGAPDPRSVAEMREALTRAARRRPQLTPLLAVTALTAVTLALLFLIPGTPAPPAVVASDRPVTLELTASNGIRIHWSVYPATPTDDRPHSKKRGTP